MNDTRLIEAVKVGDFANVENLIGSGADVNQRDDYGWTPLNWAAGKGDMALINLLLENGAERAATGRDQRTPYMIALAAGQIEAAKMLEEVGEESHKNMSAEPRKYCAAYSIGEMSRFPEFIRDGVEGEALSDNDVAFLHQDFTVTRSIWHGEEIIFDRVTTDWVRFCQETLRFSVPDDFDLVAKPQPRPAEPL